VGDAALAGRLVAGDRAAFAEMYDAYARRVYGVCAAILRDDDEAADATHDTFVLAIQRVEQLRDPERLRPWLFAIARHVCFRRLEQRKRSHYRPDVDLVLEEAAVRNDDVGEDEAAALVWAAAQGLNDRDRAVLALQLQQGLDGAELAAALGVRQANPYSLVHRARAQLDRALGALIIARLGRDNCRKLSELLTDWDGGLTPLMRKRLVRHLDSCDACQQTNARARRLSALSTLALVAPAPAEAMTASDVFDIASRAPVSTERWLPDGFPPYLDERPKRRRLALAALAVGVLGVLLLGVTVLAAGTGHARPPTVVISPVATETPNITTIPAPNGASTGTTISGPAPTVASTPTPATVQGVPASVPVGGVTPPTAGPPVTKGEPPTTVKASPPTTHAPPRTTTTMHETTFTF
jgi:RNA polymerase sigma factor (sigma-70 family)